MITQYVNIFGIKWTISMLIVFIVMVSWIYRTLPINWKMINQSKKLKIIGTGIVGISMILMIIFSIIIVLIYGENISNSMFGIISIFLTFVALFGGIFSSYFKEKINDRIFSQFGKAMLWYGIISFVGLIIYYIIWIA